MPSSWSKGSKLKHCVPAFDVVERKDRPISLKCRSCSRYFSGTCDSLCRVLVLGLFPFYPKNNKSRFIVFLYESLMSA